MTEVRDSPGFEGDLKEKRAADGVVRNSIVYLGSQTELNFGTPGPGYDMFLLHKNSKMAQKYPKKASKCRKSEFRETKAKSEESVAEAFCVPNVNAGQKRKQNQNLTHQARDMTILGSKNLR